MVVSIMIERDATKYSCIINDYMIIYKEDNE